MVQTQNYNLNIAEGTDKYNHLTIDNPNYEIIDGVMKANEAASIATATEATTGNVHAITLAKEDNAVFRFTATSDWHAGDSITVNNVNVTALLTDGTTLGEGAYKIGAEVICSLVGQRLTVYVQRGSVAIASDSEKLGGQLPSYYATALAVQNAQNTANAAGELAGQLDTRVTDLGSIVDTKQDAGTTHYSDSKVQIRTQGEIVYIGSYQSTVSEFKSALQANVEQTNHSVSFPVVITASGKSYPGFAFRAANSTAWGVRQYTVGQAATDAATSSLVYCAGFVVK